MFQMQSSGGVTFIEKMPFKISPNYNYIKKTLWYNCFPGNFEWKVRARASDVFNTNISISFLVYKNLKPNNLTDIKADFYLFFFSISSSYYLLEKIYIHLQKFCNFVMNEISASIVNILTTLFFENEERLNGKI